MLYLRLSRTLKVRGGIISQANRYLGDFCSSQRIFPPQIIQVLLLVSQHTADMGKGISCAEQGVTRAHGGTRARRGTRGPVYGGLSRCGWTMPRPMGGGGWEWSATSPCR